MSPSAITSSIVMLMSGMALKNVETNCFRQIAVIALETTRVELER